MDAKTRVNQTLMFKEVDRVPFDYWGEGAITEKLKKCLRLTSTEELLRYFNIDLRYIEGAVYCGPERAAQDDGSWLDIWGVRRKKIFIDKRNPSKGLYEHVITHPLAFAEKVRDIEKYWGWPSADWYSYSKVEQMADMYADYAVVCGGDRLNRTAQLKTSMYLRGIERIMVDIALNGKLIEAMNERIVNFFIEYNRRIFDKANGKIDIFFMGDDFGTQDSLLMSPETWRRFYKPGFRKFIDIAHRYGIRVMHHSCGAIEPLIPDFIECGLDILQSLQPRAAGMDFDRIKSEYGKDLCFHGGMDIQKTLPFGTTKDVRDEVKNVMKYLSPGGGYLFCTAHNIQADTPVENILALFDAAKEFGCYL